MFYTGTMFRNSVALAQPPTDKSEAIRAHAEFMGIPVVDVTMDPSAPEFPAIDNAAAALQRFLDSGHLIKNLPDQKSPRTITARPRADAEHDYYMGHADLCM